jgi:hypothetical protein
MFLVLHSVSRPAQRSRAARDCESITATRRLIFMLSVAAATFDAAITVCDRSLRQPPRSRTSIHRQFNAMTYCHDARAG